MSFRFLCSAVVLGGAIVVGTVPAAAQSGESGYAVVGKWAVTTVWAAPNTFGYCAATTNNGKADFRIGSDGRSWQIGTAHFGKTGKVEAYYGFGVAGEVAELRAEGDGWASMRISGDQLNAFRSAPSFSMNIGKGEQTWKLAGAAGAIAKVRECAGARGAAKAAPAVPASPAAAVRPVGAHCPAPGSVRSLKADRPLAVTFFNATKMPLDIVWIDYAGAWKKYQTVGPDKLVKQKTFATHPWIAVDARGNCHGGVMVPAANFVGETPEEQFQIWD